jgi:membrane protein required for colicin V production
MVWVDIAVIILLAHYAIKGIIGGCKKEIFSIGVLVAGVIIAWFFSHNVEILLLKFFSSPTNRLAISFLMLVMLTVIIGKIINWLLTEKGAKRLSALDRIGGLFLGVVHGWIFMIALVLVAGLTALPKDRWWHQSKYLPTLQAAAVSVKGTLDTQMASSINYR